MNYTYFYPGEPVAWDDLPDNLQEWARGPGCHLAQPREKPWRRWSTQTLAGALWIKMTGWRVDENAFPSEGRLPMPHSFRLQRLLLAPFVQLVERLRYDLRAPLRQSQVVFVGQDHETGTIVFVDGFHRR